MFLLVYLFVHSGPMDLAFYGETLPHRVFVRYHC